MIDWERLGDKVKNATRSTSPRTVGAEPSANGHHAGASIGDPDPEVFPGGKDCIELANFRLIEGEDEEGKKTVTKESLSAQCIRKLLQSIVGDWPRRVGPNLFAQDGESIRWLDDADGLFAWVARYFPNAQRNPINWARGDDKLTPTRFLAFLQQTVTPYEYVEQYPHFPPLPRHYYCHAEIKPGDGSHLNRLLARFTPATAIDADLLRAFFLSLCWGGPYGKRPAWLFTAEPGDPQGGRGVGKSHIPMAGGVLLGGQLTVDEGNAMEDIKKRLFSEDGRDKRILTLDNLKTFKFSWAELESLVTADIISGRAMYIGEGRRPNTINICITLNGANLSKDMAQRVVPVQLKRPNYSARWWEETESFIRDHRAELFGDIKAALGRPTPRLERPTRWGAWEDEVLSRATHDVQACQRAILERQGGMDGDQEEIDVIRQAFIDAMQPNYHPEVDVVFFPNRAIGAIMERATGDKRPSNRVTAYLKTLDIGELQPSALYGVRGFRWTGAKSCNGESAVEFDFGRWQRNCAIPL